MENMALDSPALQLALPQAIGIDILLSGHTAVVIAMACRPLPEISRR